MWDLFNRLPISQKLIFINVMVVSAALTIAAVTYVVSETYLGRERILQKLAGQAEILAHNSAASLTFDDSTLATEILSSLKFIPEVDRAIVFDGEGIMFAEYVSEVRLSAGGMERGSPYIFNKKLIWPSNQSQNVIFSDTGIYLVRSVKLLGHTRGTIYFQANLNEFNAYRSRLISTVLTVLLASLSVSVLIMLRAQKLISDPILHLSKAIKQVTHKSNYSVRASKLADDELGVLTDGFNGMLSQIERRDEELSRHKDKLEHEVEKRTTDLRISNIELESTVIALKQANRAIRISEENKRIAEGSAKAKSQFLANMSHELRTPMNGVLGMLELVQETELNTEQAYFIKVATDSGHNLLALLNDVLDLSKIEEGKLDVEFVEFDIRSTIDEVFSVLGEVCYQKGVELVFCPTTSLPLLVIGDPIRFKQIVYNVIGNAIKFTSSGYVQMRANIIESSDRQSKIHFEVLDTGIGIKQEALVMIFENFSQADSSTTRQYGGTGLGLAICKRLVNIMGGDIGVESEFGVGSTFWFDIVFNRANFVEESLPALTVSRVLVYDDKAISGASLKLELRNLEVFAVPVVDGDAFWRELKMAQEGSQEFDVIALSVDLAKVDFVDILDTLEKDTQLKKIPVILMGSLKRRNELAFRNESKSGQFLVKPFKRELLINILTQLSGLEVSKEKQMITQLSPLVHNVIEGDSVAHVLLVEDNKVNQLVVVGRLKRLGYATDIADNGAIALEMLGTKHYDLVFMDVQMPVLDGYSATRKIRELESDTENHIPIVAMTANAMPGDRQLCLEAGMDDYLAKPVTNESLKSILSVWLKKNV